MIRLELDICIVVCQWHQKLVFHDVVFFINRNHQLGIDIIEGYNYKYQTYEGKSELLVCLNISIQKS